MRQSRDLFPESGLRQIHQLPSDTSSAGEMESIESLEDAPSYRPITSDGSHSLDEANVAGESGSHLSLSRFPQANAARLLDGDDLSVGVPINYSEMDQLDLDIYSPAIREFIDHQYGD